MDRRSFIRSALAGLVGARAFALAPAAFAQTQGAFSFDAVVARAREAAGSPYTRPLMRMTEPFAGLKYDQYRAIRPREDKRFFADADRGFRMDLLPPGLSFQDRIEINLVENGVAEPIGFSTDFFVFDPETFPYADGQAPAADELGFSGLRLRHPINEPGVWDDFVVFQGASYFRAVSRGTIYGLSARGLAVGTGGPDPEEFPIFTAFWIHAPASGDRELRLSALLDSDSVAGAFDFTIRPGLRTVMDIRSVLFPRREIAAVGIAPLTSMYFFGPERRAGVDDFRDAVHDSEGLRMVNGSGERLWRPLRNPPALETSAFADENPRSFGLIQRARNFDHYEDAEAHYERRPGAWVEPAEPWGKGAVTLVEIPSGDEFTDNIVVMWRPATPLATGSESSFSYRLTWGPVEEEDQPIARVIATRSGVSILDPRERLFVVDFDLDRIDFDSVTPKLEVSAGEAKGLSFARLPDGNAARVGFHFVAGDLPSAEFRLWLTSGDVPASEVWLYRWSR